MPLNTQVLRNNRPRKDIKWGGFHVAAMVCAAAWDSDIGPFVDNSEPEMQEPEMTTATKDEAEKMFGPLGHYISPKDVWELMNYGVIAATPLNDGSYTLKKNYTFVDSMDGEVFELKAGDTLKVWRD